MFKEMRRGRQQLTHEACRAILDKMTSGVLALNDRDGYPYAVPLSYVSCGDKIYFHSALRGHKIELLERDPRVSFCVVGQDRVVPEEFTTYFRSVIVFGKARLLTDASEKRAALEKLGKKYAPDDPQGLSAEIGRGIDRLHMVEITVERMTGKESIELVRKKRIGRTDAESPNVQTR